MVEGHAFGELLEACLAINLAYLALERFRYRDAISRIIEKAEAHVAGMPAAVKVDLAYENWTSVRVGRGPGAKHPILHGVYRGFLNNGADRKIITVAATLAFLTLIYRAIAPELSASAIAFERFWEWPLLIYMVIVTGLTALMISMGRRCVHCVAETVIENVGHLGQSYLEKNEPAFERMTLFIREVQDTHIGPDLARQGQ